MTPTTATNSPIFSEERYNLLCNVQAGRIFCENYWHPVCRNLGESPTEKGDMKYLKKDLSEWLVAEDLVTFDGDKIDNWTVRCRLSEKGQRLFELYSEQISKPAVKTAKRPHKGASLEEK